MSGAQLDSVVDHLCKFDQNLFMDIGEVVHTRNGHTYGRTDECKSIPPPQKKSVWGGGIKTSIPYRNVVQRSRKENIYSMCVIKITQ